MYLYVCKANKKDGKKGGRRYIERSSHITFNHIGSRFFVLHHHHHRPTIAAVVQFKYNENCNVGGDLILRRPTTSCRWLMSECD